MRVSQEAAKKFNSLYTLLLYYAGQERRLFHPEMTLDEFRDGPHVLKIRCRDAIYEPTLLIGRFRDANADLLSGVAQATLDAWEQNYVKATFAVLKHQKKNSIFVTTEGAPKAYAVLGLTEELSDMIPKGIMPALVKTVLLPYEGVIVCDGLIVAAGHVTLDAEMEREVSENYKAIQKSGELITTLG